MKDKLSILISSCDKYSHLLPYFSHQFDKYWKSGNTYKKYLYTETTVLEHPDYIPILTEESNWTNSLLIALDKLETEYVFIILDDFFLVRNFESFSIENAVKILEETGSDKYVYHYPHVAFQNTLDETSLGPNIYKVQQNSEYTMTLQPAIWRISFFKKCLKAGESPWQFEIDGSARVNNTIPHKILMEKIPYGYHREAMCRGEYTKEYYEILKYEGLS